jgi:hypothetical protein
VTVPVATDLHVRVWVPAVWDIVPLKVSSDWTVARLKETALRAATGRQPDLADFEVKYRGGQILDEDATLAGLEVPNDAAFIVLRSRRQPVR